MERATGFGDSKPKSINVLKERHERISDYVKDLRYMDDVFFTACLSDNPAAVELILRIVLKEEITVESVAVQQVLQNLHGHSTRLDVHAIDSRGRSMNIEIQRSRDGAAAERARYYSSLLDSYLLKPGENYGMLPDSYVIFITENDVFGDGEPIIQ